VILGWSSVNGINMRQIQLTMDKGMRAARFVDAIVGAGLQIRIILLRRLGSLSVLRWEGFEVSLSQITSDDVVPTSINQSMVLRRAGSP
jgi:hypothetical protein